MKRIRKLLAAVMCVICFTSLYAPVQASAAEAGHYTYEVHDGKATITGCTWTNASYLEIPRTIDGYPVVAVGANAFAERNDLLGVIVSEGIELIDYRAFWCCQNLRWVVLPDSLTTIGDEAFSVCTNLLSVDFGKGLKTIGYAAFAHCSNLFDAELPEGLETIGMSAFYKCYSLESVWLPDSLKALGARAYDSCVSLCDIYIPDTVTSIGANVLYDTPCYYNNNFWYSDAFYIGSHLLDVKPSVSGSYTVLPGTVLIAGGAFEYCDDLTEVILPDSLQTIGTRAFYSCNGLSAITIPANVTTIEDEAFYWCKSLTDVRFQGSVNNVGQNAFAKTPYYESAETWVDNALYAGETLISCKPGFSGALQVRPGTKTIAPGAMQGLTKLTEVILPEGLTTIGENAFYGCTKLTELNLPDSVTTIGNNAFFGCTNLKVINLGKGLTNIGDSAFGQCKNIETITVHNENNTFRSLNNTLIRRQDKCLVMGCKGSRIPDDGSVTSIGTSAFEGCVGLTELTIPDTIHTIGYAAFKDCDNLMTLSLGNGVKTVGGRAFESCDALTEIDFGQSVETIENHGFAYNHQLKTLDLPASLKYLGEEAFSNGTGIRIITFREGLQSIGKNCFIFCDNLTAVHLPNSLVEIESGAFYDCQKLESLTLGENLTTIGDTAFMGCEALLSVKIPAKVHDIGSSAFAECYNLRLLDLGNVETIGAWAFSSCEKLQQIHVPATVKEIGLAAFAYCESLEMLTVSQQNPYYHSGGNCIISTEDKVLIAGCKNSIIPDDGSVTIVNGYSFGGCTGLKRIVVPDTVKRIMYYAFADCSGLEFMQLPFIGADGGYTQCFGHIFGGNLNDFVPASLKRVVITGGNVADGYAFYKCMGLEEIVLPESIERLNYLAFASCPNLQRVILPGDVKIVDESEIFQGSPNAVLYISAGMENTKAYAEAHNLPYKVGGLVTILDDQNKVLDRTWYFLGGKIKLPTVADKPADDTYTYETLWEPAPDYCTGNQTIRLRYAAHRINGAAVGDLTGDDKINSLDGLLLMRYLNGWDVNVAAAEAMDINGDGKLNSRDVIAMMRQIIS